MARTEKDDLPQKMFADAQFSGGTPIQPDSGAVVKMLTEATMEPLSSNHIHCRSEPARHLTTETPTRSFRTFNHQVSISKLRLIPKKFSRSVSRDMVTICLKAVEKTAARGVLAEGKRMAAACHLCQKAQRFLSDEATILSQSKRTRRRRMQPAELTRFSG